jgi:hypothetical protein
MAYVIPFVGVLVQKAVPTLGAQFTTSPSKAGKATVQLSATALPTGTVKVLEGGKQLGSGTLQPGDEGALGIKLPKLSKGQHKLTVKYVGSSVVSAAKQTFTVTSR